MSDSKKLSVVPVVLAGGIGSRLWPLSRTKKPKQFCSFFEGVNDTLFDETLCRIKQLEESSLRIKKCFVMTGKRYRDLILSSRKIMSMGAEVKLFLEPSSRNTVASMSLAASYADEDDILVMLPSDHDFDERAFQRALHDAVKVCQKKDAICLIGIVASNPETGYGYIQVQKANEEATRFMKVISFHEKPDFDTASKFLSDGNFYWNSGIIVVRAGRWIECLKILRPDILDAVQQVVTEFVEVADGQIGMDEKLFSNIPKESVDYAVLEKMMEHKLPMYVVPCYGHWSDLGTWKMVYSHSKKDCEGNVLIGDVRTKDCKDSYFFSKDKLLVGLGLNNISVIATSDVVVAFPISESENVKAIVESLSSEFREELVESRQDVKPWGGATTFYSSSNECKVKRLVVNSGQSISLQRHRYREEHWVIVSGSGKVVKDGETSVVKKGDYIYIPQESVHRICAEKESIVLIEVQMGSELSEDDIDITEDENFG